MHVPHMKSVEMTIDWKSGDAETLTRPWRHGGAEADFPGPNLVDMPRSAKQPSFYDRGKALEWDPSSGLCIVHGEREPYPLNSVAHQVGLDAKWSFALQILKRRLHSPLGQNSISPLRHAPRLQVASNATLILSRHPMLPMLSSLSRESSL
jgi:hypothetical protein